MTGTVVSVRDAWPRVQAPMRILLALPVVSLSTPIELYRLHHKCNEWLDERPEPLRLEHQRDHRIRIKLVTHCLTEGLPCHTPFCTDEECVLCGIHWEIAVATHLLVSLLDAPQVRGKTAMAWERLRQIKSDFPILKAWPHGPFSTSLIKSFQHWSRLFFMPCLKAAFALFHASCSITFPFERVNFRRAARNSRRMAANWSFHQYIEPLACLRLRRGIE